MKVAANRGDWEMVKWLFAHFSDGQVPWEVAAAAAWSGNLPMLQFLLVNDAGRRDVEEGGGQKKREVEAMEREIQSETVSEGNPRGSGEHVVTWGPWVMASAKRGKHSTIVQWLNEYVLGEEEDEQGKDKKREIVAALEDGDDALAKALMPPGRCVLDYAAQCSRLDLIKMMLEWLLFLHEHFPHVLTPELTTKWMLDQSFRRDQVDVVAWLAKNQSSNQLL
ncbi:hypothetical protein PRNP1_007952 [Phytophthora ramorum]